MGDRMQNMMAASGTGKLLNMTVNIPCLGAKYLKECTQQNYIPVYLLVSGVFSMAMLLLACLPCGQNDNPVLKCISNVWTSLVSVFTFCWLIAGSVWIYSIYPPNYNSTVVGKPYCNKTLYLFAFWTTTVGYIILGILLVVYCCFLVCVCVCSSKSHSEPEPQA
ncbi:transmembrane protein 272-like isoform X2 [Tachysurus fulvidraco]|uniref:transmembrane protein 272-like isoform X2 n=1 Tax=Tachysurus fulvidraco TaxID=1234273 RepID=UPI001FEDCC7F|nr:transmembrane protein 272-like isoform X2 [Tachysurus fulvidraco]